MQHVTLASLLFAGCLSTAAQAQAPLPPAPGEHDLPTGQAQTRLYNVGARRLLVLEDGRHIRLDPAGAQALRGRFVDSTGQWRLSGSLGRYRLSRPDGRQEVLDFTTTETDADADAEDAVLHCPVDCDTTSVPASADFADGTGIAGAARIDLRPASCRSYFTDYPPIERGTRIEAALTRQGGMPGLSATVRTFPQVDWYDDAELVVMHSRDLASDSLDGTRHPNALFDQLMADGQAIVDGVVERLATQGHITVRDGLAHTRLEAEPERRVVLTVLVRYGLASPAQHAQIAAARRELAHRHGIELRIIEIP